MKKVIKFFRLPAAEKKLFVQTLFLIILIRIGLSLFSFKKVTNWLSRINNQILPETENHQINIDSIVRTVRFCSRFVPYASCLTQALAVRVLLKRCGQTSDLKIGFLKNQKGEFLAHAWIEVGGQIVIGKQKFHERFNVLSSSEQVVI